MSSEVPQILMRSDNLTRRDFLRRAGLLGLTAAASTIGLSACSAPAPSAETRAVAPSQSRAIPEVPESVKPYVLDLNTDPIFRAASLTAFTKDGQFVRAFLVRNIEDWYRLVTTRQQYFQLQQMGNEVLVNIPGLGVRPLNLATSLKLPGTGKAETFAQALFDTTTCQEIDQLKAAGALTPLRLSTRNLEQHDAVRTVRTDTGQFIGLTVSEQLRNSTQWGLSSNRDVLCGNVQGAPVLRTYTRGFNGRGGSGVTTTTTSEVVAILTGRNEVQVKPDPKNISSESCSFILFADPITL